VGNVLWRGVNGEIHIPGFGGPTAVVGDTSARRESGGTNSVADDYACKEWWPPSPSIRAEEEGRAEAMGEGH
jgi:hypothetical protein